MELVFDGVFLGQLAQFDLHLDQLFALCLLAAVHEELQLFCSLLISAAFLPDLPLNHCLLIQLNM